MAVMLLCITGEIAIFMFIKSFGNNNFAYGLPKTFMTYVTLKLYSMAGLFWLT